MNLGPNQQKWVKALRSNRYQQGEGQLCRDEKYCCLGIWCDVSGYSFKGDGSKTYLFNDDENIWYLPGNSYVELALRNNAGVFSREIEGYGSLAMMNDSGKTFNEIADFIEKYPEIVFLRSK